MPILFSAVAYDKDIVAKYACCDGNFMEILDEVILRVPRKNHKMTYSHGPYLFHYIVDDEHFFFCITDKTCQRSRAFLFLNEMQRRYKRTDINFTHVLAEEMYRYSEDYSTITIRKGELDELNSIGVGCSESILGEKILLVSKPEEVTFSTISYVGETSHTPQHIATYVPPEPDISKNSTFKMYFVILTVILVFIWLVLSTMGPTTFVVIACVFVMFLAKMRKPTKSE